MKAGRSYLFQGESVPQAVLERFARIDQLEIDGQEIDVKALRSVVANASQQALGDQRLLLIRNADRLNDQLQNTLLKLLEEPPATLVIVLQTSRPQALLATVRSRLHGAAASASALDSSEGVLIGIADIKTSVEKAKDRGALITAIEGIRQQLRGKLLTEPSSELIAAINLLDRSLRRLAQNVNQKLVIDALLLNWPLQSSRSG